MSPRRAYAEVLGVFAAFFGASAIYAGFAFAGRLEPEDPSGSWALYLPATFDLLVSAGLSVLVVVLLVRHRSGSLDELGLAVRRDEQGVRRWWAEARVAAWAWLALLVGMGVMAAMATESIPPGPSNAANLLYQAAVSVNAGLMEELVVLAFVVATLRAARRQPAEIFAVAVLLRVSYHLYYGVGAVGIVVWAAAFAWLFWRTRSLLPLIAVHVWWDLMVSFGDHVAALGGIMGITGLALLVVAPISWMIEQAHRPAVPAYGATPPGWHRDPWGLAAWRWWDGAQWTATVSPDGYPAANT